MFKKILLAIDLNDAAGATRAADYGGQLASMCGADLHLLTVIPDPGFALVGAALGPDHATNMRREASEHLKDWAATHLPASAETTIHVAQGTIYDQIIKTADKISADAIVVGAHRPELKDYLVGPNAARVVRHASQNVLVVR